MNVFRIIFCLLLLAAATAQAQDSTVRELKPTVITTPRSEEYTAGSKVKTIPADIQDIYKNANLSDLLNAQSTIFVKSYGSGGIATTSFRGTAAEHTAVMWNGFNILNPMLGLFDFSLVPNNFVDEVSIQYGSATSLFGSGAIGGVIHLRSLPTYNSGVTLSLGANYGSFNAFRQQAAITVSGKKAISKTRLFGYNADNNFSYINTEKFGSPEETLVHAKVKQVGAMQDNYFKVKGNQQIGVHYWYQYKEAEIPPSLTQNISTAVQKDEFSRLTVDWATHKNNTVWQARTGYFNDWVNFEDDPLNIHSSNHFTSSISELEMHHNFSKTKKLNIGLNNTYTISSSTSNNQAVLSTGTPTRSQQALFAAYQQKILNNKLLVNVSGRAEVIDNDLKPVTPSLAVEYKLSKYSLVRAKAARNYRVPTINSLYWQGSGAEGNPDLKPELGWSYEIGYYATKIVSDKEWLDFDVSGYSSYINNWMLWVQEPDNIWRPRNVREVWSRGAELSLGFNKKVADSTLIRLGMQYSYVKSTVEATEFTNQELLGKQLIYVPLESAQLNLGITHKTYLLNINVNHVGWRYTSSDNDEKLTPYNLVNVALNKVVQYKNHQLVILARANNVLNTDYQALLYRPTPKANYELGLNLNLNSKQKNK